MVASVHVPDQDEYGDYEFTFTKAIPERLYCSICTKVFRNPHLTGCCGQHFCESCLQLWFKKQKKTTCPHCRHDNFIHILNKALKREVDELEIQCTKQKMGCQWVGELKSIQTHLDSDKGCGYVEMQCSNKCGAMMKRKELEAHIAQQCPLRKTQCQYCQYEDTYQTIINQHYNKCPCYPLPCPNMCGATGIQRANMANHRSRCELEPMECPFYEAGCTVRVLRREFGAHMSGNQQNHLLVLLRTFEETKKRLSESEKELGICQRRLHNTTVKLLETRQELEESKTKPAEKKTLKHLGDKLTFYMTNFSLYKQTGKVWHSPPFYFKDEYKLCLAVYANGKGAGAGTHVSVELLQMRGEHDDKWWWERRPIIDTHNRLIFPNVSIQLLPHLDEIQSHQRKYSLEFHLCSECFRNLPPHKDLRVCKSRGMSCSLPISKEKLIEHQTADQLMVLNDTITLRIGMFFN